MSTTTLRNRQVRFAVLAALSSASTLSGMAVHAGDIALDGSLPGTTAGALDAVNGIYEIGQNQGFLSGTNLFHSFEVFNLDVDETAIFSGNAAITNIISRVTGGIATTIDGTIRSTVNGANFWFVNPAGLTVGPTGAIDVSGAVALGAADYIDFANGERFMALLDGDEVGVSLSMSAPVDFGFLDGAFAGELRIESSELLSRTAGATQGQIQPLDGSGSFSLLLSGGSGVFLETEGDIELHQARIRTGSSFAAGNIEVRAGGSIDMSGSDLLTSAPADGFGFGGGDIFIQGGELVSVSNSSVVAQSIDAQAATGSITISGSGVLINDYSQISLDFRAADGGIEGVGAGTLTIASTGVSTEVAPQSELSAATDGVVRIVDSSILARNSGGQVISDSGFPISTITIGNQSLLGLDEFPDGSAGTSRIVIAGAVIAGDATGGGNAASIRIAADEGVWIGDSNNGSSTLSATASDTARQAGSIDISAGPLALDGFAVLAPDGAGVTIQNTLIDTRNSAVPTDFGFSDVRVDVSAAGAASLSNVTIRTDADNGFDGGSVFVSGNTVQLSSSTLTTSTTLRDPSAATGDFGHAGTIRLAAGPFLDGEVLSTSDQATLSVENSILRANASNDGSPDSDPIGGAAGVIDLSATVGTLRVTGSTLESAGLGVNSGAAGQVLLAGGDVEVASSTINVASETLNPAVADSGSDQARSIQLNALDGVRITDSTLTATTSGVSVAGDVFALANSVDLTRSTVQASTTGSGAAGSILFFGINLGGIFGEPVPEPDPDEPEPGEPFDPFPFPAPQLGPTFLRFTDSTLSTSTGSTPSNAGSIIALTDGPIDIVRSTLNVSVTAQEGPSAPDVGDVPVDIDQFGVASISLFTGAQPVTITDSTLQANTTGLVNGGNIDITGTALLVRNASITASSSASTGPGTELDPGVSAGEISLGVSNEGGFGVPDGAAQLGPIIIESSTIATNAAAANGGDIAIVGGGDQLILRNSSIAAAAGGAGAGGDILLAGTSQLTLQSTQVQATAETGAGGSIQILLDAAATAPTLIQDSSIATSATAADGGDIVLDGGGSVLVLQNSSVLASAGGSGVGGDIGILDVGAGTVLQNSQIQALANAGSGGTISVALVPASGGTLQIQDTQITANATAANGGDIAIDTGGAQLQMQRSSIVASAGGTGQGGDIAIVGAAGAALLDSQLQALADGGSGGTINLDLSDTASGPVVLDNSSIRTNALNSNGGNITVDAAGNAVTLDDSMIIASAGGNGVGGGISITNAGTTTLSGSQVQALANMGAGGTINIAMAPGQNGSLTLDNSSIRSNAAAANGGNISIDAAGNRVALRDSSIVASAGGNGVGGGISILNAGGATLQNTQVQALASAGAGGTITLDLTDNSGAMVLDNSSITTNADAAGGGNITLDAAGNQVVLRGASIVASAGGNGAGGDISILGAGGATLQDTQIQALANAGAGGTIDIEVRPGGGTVLIQRTNITTNAVAAGGGNIRFDAGGNQVLLRDSTILASAGAAGTGGNVLIDNLGRTIMQRSQILARADAGNGGTITLNLIPGALFLRDAQSTISADSNSGNDGQVAINSPDTDLNPAVKLQDATLGETPELSASACVPASEAARSTFVRDSRGGVSPSPDGYLVSIESQPAPQASAAAAAARPAAEQGVRVVAATQISTEGCR